MGGVVLDSNGFAHGGLACYEGRVVMATSCKESKPRSNSPRQLRQSSVSAGPDSRNRSREAKSLPIPQTKSAFPPLSSSGWEARLPPGSGPLVPRRMIVA